MQDDLINTQLTDWKIQQKRAQIGTHFDEREEQLDNIQAGYTVLW